MQIKYLPTSVYRLNRIANNQQIVNETVKTRLKHINKFDKLKRTTNLKDHEICEILEVSRASIFNWKKRYKAQKEQGLLNKSRTPHKKRTSTQTKELKDLVLMLRKENPTYGKAKIHALLKRDHNLHTSESTVGRILKKLISLGSIDLVHHLYTPKKRRVFDKYAKRFVYGMKAKTPGELVQIDHMSVYSPTNFKVKHFAAIDPTTKYLEAQSYGQATSRTAAKFLEHLIENSPFEIKSIQVDGGSEFMKDFENACKEKNIALYVLPPRKPKWNGCVERSNRTLREEFYQIYQRPADMAELREMLEEYVLKYNTYRPHHSLKLKTPMCYYIDNFKEVA